jgi:formylglycine-generating enzyme required for sulfatase activity
MARLKRLISVMLALSLLTIVIVYVWYDDEFRRFLGNIRIRSTDNMIMVFVPYGEFWMGSDEEAVDYAVALCREQFADCTSDIFYDETPSHLVELDGYWIDSTEVSNNQYRQCVEAGACDLPENDWPCESNYDDLTYGDYPVVCVDWYQAVDYCTWVEARLPTEAEWEYAARGPEGRRFPWGDEFDETQLNFCDANCPSLWARRADEVFDDGYPQEAPAGNYPDGASWCGALDMAGNVSEWVADWSWPSSYSRLPARNPTGSSYGWAKVYRGGSWGSPPFGVCSTYRRVASPVVAMYQVGFRCVQDSEISR